LLSPKLIVVPSGIVMLVTLLPVFSARLSRVVARPARATSRPLAVEHVAQICLGAAIGVDHDQARHFGIGRFCVMRGLGHVAPLRGVAGSSAGPLPNTAGRCAFWG